jgi:hypothetical protein
VNDLRFGDEALDRWRSVGDEPADRLARTLLDEHGYPGPDGARPDELEVLGRAVQAVVQGRATAGDAALGWYAEDTGLPDWADAALVARGQRFFGDWPLPVATTLFCASLPSAYAAPCGAAVLGATSHMAKRPLVARRLADTGQMLFDVMGYPEPGIATLAPGGRGWVSARGVRLLHAVVRQGLLAAPSTPWPAGRCGVPINQEDLVGALFTFTVSVLDGLATLGIPVSDEDERAYVHAWSVVGWLLGVDPSFLPLTPEAARAGAATIRRRQLGESPAGTELAFELLAEMRMAMPAGCQGLPAALVHLLEPEVAALLHIPRPAPHWRRALAGSQAFARTWHAAPGLNRVTARAAAMVGGSLLRMYIDRAAQPDGPAYRIDPEVLGRAVGGGGWRRRQRRDERRRRRGDVVGVGPHVGPTPDRALAALAHPIDPPLGPRDVRAIASEGYPLWEPVPVMVQRNRRVTVGYADLSRRLAQVIAGPGGVLDANWCTFATWSSKTIGTFIESIPDAGAALPEVGPLPGRDPRSLLTHPRLARLTRRVMTRSNGASFRTLAAGNRVVFLEIGQAVAHFVQRFPKRATAWGIEGEEAWRDYWDEVEAQLDDIGVLDPSWLLTEHPPPDDLRLGLRQYFEALRADDPHERSQYVLAGNLLLGAYEQRRVDGYVSAALALDTDSAMRRLIRDRSGAAGGVRRAPSRLFATLMTRRMPLGLGAAFLWVGRPVPPPDDPADAWHELRTDADVTLPVLQALITRYQLSVGRRPNRGARDWTDFDQRMRTIGNLFRLRQRQRDLFDDPFPPEEIAALLGRAGEPGATGPPAP